MRGSLQDIYGIEDMIKTNFAQEKTHDKWMQYVKHKFCVFLGVTLKANVCSYGIFSILKYLISLAYS